MTPPFQDILQEATRLTRSGQLQAATELLQRGLRGAGGVPNPFAEGPPATADAGLVIDVESRIVADNADGTGSAGHTVGAGFTGGTVGKGGAGSESGAGGAGDDVNTRDAPMHEHASASAAERQAAASTQPSPPASTARPAAASAEQWLRGSFTHQGRQLDYRLYVPPLPAGAKAPPLLLMLHGCTQDADDFAAGTRMNALAREAGVIVLYPEQTAHANAQRCWNWFKPQHQGRERGEPAVLAALTRKIATDHQADPARIYAAGLSAGGAMAAILGSRHADLFAAVGVHSGLPAGAARDLPSALAAMRSGAPAGPAAPNTHDGTTLACPLIVFHGDADATVHPRNGQALVEAARTALQGVPGGQAGRQVNTGKAPGGQAFTRTVLARPEGGSALEYWQLHGAGHAWSGGSASGSYTDPAGVDASAEMLRFFLAQRRG
jgi:poly(hydroxyalkanoate) depolymerase family esterase